MPEPLPLHCSPSASVSDCCLISSLLSQDSYIGDETKDLTTSTEIQPHTHTHTYALRNKGTRLKNTAVMTEICTTLRENVSGHHPWLNYSERLKRDRQPLSSHSCPGLYRSFFNSSVLASIFITESFQPPNSGTWHLKTSWNRTFASPLG